MIKRLLARKNTTSLNAQQNAESVYFVHIPKTAGTSFKNALEEQLPIYKDYGVNSPETHSDIRTLVYEKNDVFQLKSVLKQGSVICGHVGLMKYADFVPVSKILTIVREPIAQIVSHYNHYVQHYGLEAPFSQFVRDARFCNVQSKYLGNFPVELMGFVGVTEDYAECVGMLSEHLGLSIPEKHSNISGAKAAKHDALESDLISDIKQRNAADFELYSKAQDLHQQRKQLRQKGKPWTYLTANVNANFALNGCAFFNGSTEIVELDVAINGEHRRTIEAKQFYHPFSKVNFPRERYIAFHLPLRKWLKEGENQIELSVKATGQKNVLLVNKTEPTQKK
ncbi:hypothetical protein ACPV50_18630 [Vibrio astriarenae]